MKRLGEWLEESMLRLWQRPFMLMTVATVAMAVGYEAVQFRGGSSPWHPPGDAFGPPAPSFRLLPPAPEPQALYELGDGLSRETLRHILEGDEAAAELDLPDYPVVKGRFPRTGGPALKSRAWYVADAETGEVLLANRADVPMPIASISKLMGALIYADSQADPDEAITLQAEDKEFIQITRSRLRVGAQYYAHDLFFHMMLPSDNRATVALQRQTGLPLEVFKEAMNRRAEQLGLRSAHFEEPTGLDPGNVASARDVAVLMEAALAHPEVGPVIRQKEHWYYRADAHVMLGARSSNRLAHNETWDVIASKTGFTYVAGSCLAMKARLNDGREIVMGLLGAPGEKGRYPEAEAIRSWLEGRED